MEEEEEEEEEIQHLENVLRNMRQRLVDRNNEPQYKVLHCRSAGRKWTVFERRVPAWYATETRAEATFPFRSTVMVVVEEAAASCEVDLVSSSRNSEDGVDI